MIRNKKLIRNIFIVIAVLILITSIAFAALSQTLNISTNKVTQSAQSWNIGFEAGTINGVLTATDPRMATCGAATVTSDTITGINVILENIGDKCAYTFNLKNSGTIGGKLTNLVVTKPTSTSCSTSGSTMVCGNITYKLRYDTATSNTLVTLNDTIAPKSGNTPTTRVVVLTAEYTGSSLASDDFQQNGFAYTLTYSQK